MPRIAIRGYAAVFHDDQQVIDETILRSLDGIVYDEERFTDYIGGPPDENALLSALEPGGMISFAHRDGDEVLIATTEYVSRRTLSEAELRLLVEYTMGQWSDGIGENWTCLSQDKCGYTIMCITDGDCITDSNPAATDYPAVDVTSD